ncbi:MAG: hypothetical protein WCK78_17935 [Paludibacter sp.]
MNNPESIKIINRFYQAIDTIVSMKLIRGKKTFTDRYNIDRRRFILVSRTPESDSFQLVWITYLVKDFGVSAQWIMTGNGEMFVADKFNKESQK